MLRGILRNVQFYLLLSSGLLALLAFQHLNWYDQGIFPYAHTLIDKPSYGSPDESTRGVLYYGDEAKEIGIFKFRVGLFKFALPRFSQNDLSNWEEGEGRLTVPRPPNYKRKNAIREDRKGLMTTDTMDTSRTDQIDSKQQPEVSIAYVVIIPSHDDKTILSLREKAAVLSASIKRAHTSSPREYQLYALNYEHPSSTNIEKSCVCSRTCRELMNQLGYKIVDLPTSDLEFAINSKRENTQDKGDILNHQNLKDFLANNIVVHISLESFLLKPMDSVFDGLLNENSSQVVLASHGVSSKNGLLQKKTAVPKDFLTIQAASAHETSYGSQLYIYKTTSNDAIASYLELLKCLSSTQFGYSDLQVPIASGRRMEGRDFQQHVVFPKIRSLLASAVPRTKQTEVELPHQDNGDQCTIGNKSAVLDVCIYAAGSHKSCSHVDTKTTAIIATFLDNDVCMKPWECKRNENNGCIDQKDGVSVDAGCDWLQNEWFRFAKSV